MEAHPDVGMVYGNSLYWTAGPASRRDAARDYLPVMDPTDGPADGSEVLYRQLRGKTASPCPCAVLLRKSLVERVGGSEVQFRRTHEDIVLYAKLLLSAPVIVLAAGGTAIAATRARAPRSWRSRFSRGRGPTRISAICGGSRSTSSSTDRRHAAPSSRPPVVNRLRYPRSHRAMDAGRRVIYRLRGLVGKLR